MSETMPPIRRALSPPERRLVRARIRRLVAARRCASRTFLARGAGVIFLLWLVSILASDSPWSVITLFWCVGGACLLFWGHQDLRRWAGRMDATAERLEWALRGGEVEVYDVRATSFAELEEIEDEGACYAFQIADDRLLFFVGQDFYAEGRFPSHDFTLVCIPDSAGRITEMFIHKRGPTETPARRISASVKQTLSEPGHLEVRKGRIEELEAILRP